MQSEQGEHLDNARSVFENNNATYHLSGTHFKVAEKVSAVQSLCLWQAILGSIVLIFFVLFYRSASAVPQADVAEEGGSTSLTGDGHDLSDGSFCKSLCAGTTEVTENHFNATFGCFYVRHCI